MCTRTLHPRRGRPTSGCPPRRQPCRRPRPRRGDRDHSGSFTGPILHQAPYQRWLRAPVAEEEATTQDGHPHGDPGPDPPEPGRNGKTQAIKGDIRGRIDLAPAMAGCPGLARQPTIEEIGQGDAHIQQEQACPPSRRSVTMRVDEEPQKQGNCPKPRQGEAACGGQVKSARVHPVE